MLLDFQVEGKQTVQVQTRMASEVPEIENPNTYTSIPAVETARQQLHEFRNIFLGPDSECPSLVVERVVASWLVFADTMARQGAAPIPVMVPRHFAEACRRNVWRAMDIASAAAFDRDVEIAIAANGDMEHDTKIMRKFLKTAATGNIIKGFGAGAGAVGIGIHPSVQLFMALTMAWVTQDKTIDHGQLTRSMDGYSVGLAPAEGERIPRYRDNSHRDARLGKSPRGRLPCRVRTPRGVLSLGHVQFMFNLGAPQDGSTDAATMYVPGSHMLSNDEVRKALVDGGILEGRSLERAESEDWVVVRRAGAKILAKTIASKEVEDSLPWAEPDKAMVYPVTEPAIRGGDSDLRYVGFEQGSGVAFFSDTIHRGVALTDTATTGCGASSKKSEAFERVTKYMCVNTPRMLENMRRMRVDGKRVPPPVGYWMKGKLEHDKPAITTPHWGTKKNSHPTFLQTFRRGPEIKQMNERLELVQECFSAASQVDAWLDCVGAKTDEERRKLWKMIDALHGVY